jgi:hypothetical protein
MSLCEARGRELLLELLDAGAQIASDRIPPHLVDLRVSLEGHFSVATVDRPYLWY